MEKLQILLVLSDPLEVLFTDRLQISFPLKVFKIVSLWQLPQDDV